MKKMLFHGLLGVLAASLAACGTAGAPPAPQPTSEPPAASPAPAQKRPDFQNAVYEVEGGRVTLVNGLSEVPAAPGSASKITTQIAGEAAFGDLDGDGRDDAAFLMVQGGAGSGTFYYVTAALQAPSGSQGVNAVLLGDRIEPRSVRIQGGLVLVTYADRKPGEPFSTPPSVELTRTFRITAGRLGEVITTGLHNRSWRWVGTQMNDGTTHSPRKKDAFTLTFREDGILEGSTDCNSFSGTFTLNGSRLSLGPWVSTLMACEGSQEGEFLKILREVDSFLLDEQAGRLVLLVKYDSGSMLFE